MIRHHALYSNLLGDPENIDQIFVTRASESDGPHIVQRRQHWHRDHSPDQETGAFVKQVVGSNATRKTFARPIPAKSTLEQLAVGVPYQRRDGVRSGRGADKVEGIFFSTLAMATPPT